MSDKGTISERTRLPLGLVASLVGMTALLTVEWAAAMNRMDTYHRENMQFYKDALTEKQAQEWIDNARELNPNVKWPRLPAKNEAPSLSMQADAVIARQEP